MDIINARKRSATDDLFQGAEKVPTPNERSTSIQQSVDMGDVSVLEEIHDPNLEERTASGDQSTGAANDPTLLEHSSSNQQVVVPGIVSDLKKSDDWDQMKQASFDQLSTESHITSDPKKDDLQLKDHIKADKLSAGASAQLSFVASHVTANFKDRIDITTSLSRPVAKKEQGKFQFIVNKVSNLGTNTTYSPVHVIGNLPWKLGVQFECSHRTGNIKFLSVYIDCNWESDSMIWSCDSEIDFRLLSSDSKREPFVKKESITHKFGNPGTGEPKFLEWNQFMDPENGYVTNDEATIEVEITINKMIGFRGFSEFDFLAVDSPGSYSDVVLVVGGQRIIISKHYLSIYSPVFHAMFFSEFIERDKKEIVLEDVVLDEFLQLLHVIYPTHKPVTKDNIEFLLKLSDRFEVQFAIDECERFLITSNEVIIAKKLIYAEQYCLSKLQDVCMKTINKYADLKALKLQVEYKEFTSETKAALLERLFKVQL